MGTVQAAIANGVLDAVRAGDIPKDKVNDLGIIYSVWLDPVRDRGRRPRPQGPLRRPPRGDRQGDPQGDAATSRPSTGCWRTRTRSSTTSTSWGWRGTSDRADLWDGVEEPARVTRRRSPVQKEGDDGGAVLFSLTVALFISGPAVIQAADLTKIERVIAKEPKYQGKPHPCSSSAPRQTSVSGWSWTAPRCTWTAIRRGQRQRLNRRERGQAKCLRTGRVVRNLRKCSQGLPVGPATKMSPIVLSAR